MRELTKSILSLSWALSLLGLKQAVNLVQPAQPGQPAGINVFAPVAQAAAEQIDESMADVYRSGENMQSRAVDMAFKLIDAPMRSQNPAVGNESNVGTASNVPPFPNLIRLMNPMTWMRMVGGMQNCGPCGTQAAPTGPQPYGTPSAGGSSPQN
jgi:hypothetical protein